MGAPGGGTGKPWDTYRFSDDPQCLFRIEHELVSQPMVLADGTELKAGDALIAINLWNEHLPAKSGTFTPALAYFRDFQVTWRQLAQFLESRPDLDAVRAIHGEIGFLSDERVPQMRRFTERIGLQLIPGERPGWNPLRRSFWRNVESWYLLRRFSPASLERTGFRQMRRCGVWVSRDALLAKHGAHAVQGHQYPIVLDDLPLLRQPVAVRPVPAGAGD